MPDAALADQLTETARQMLNATSETFVDGHDVAREIGRDPSDPGAEMYHAFREIERRGSLRLESWRPGMGLPVETALEPLGTTSAPSQTGTTSHRPGFTLAR